MAGSRLPSKSARGKSDRSIPTRRPKQAPPPQPPAAKAEEKPREQPPPPTPEAEPVTRADIIAWFRRTYPEATATLAEMAQRYSALQSAFIQRGSWPQFRERHFLELEVARPWAEMQLRLEKERIQREEARRQQQVPLPEKRRRRPKEDLAICALLALYPAGTPLPESADKQTLKLVNDWFEANGDATRISPDTLARALSRIRTGIRN